MKSRYHTALVKAGVAFLSFKGFSCWQQNVGAVIVKDKDTDKERFIRFGVPGMSDIIGWSPKGLFLAAEAKIGRDKPSMVQKAFLESVRASGGIAVVFWNLDDLADGIRGTNGKVKKL